MLVPCDKCSPCLDVTIPTTGFESETPDSNPFIAYNYGIPGIVPPLNSPFDRVNCVVFCEAPTEQQAEQCAEVAQIECLANPPNECQLPPGQAVFLNNPQDCVFECPDGLPFVFTVPQGTYAAFTQAQADAMAQSFACSEVAASKVCLSNLSQSEICFGSSATCIASATGAGPYRFTIISGVVPPGMQFISPDTFHFEITGTPTKLGSYSFVVEAVDPRENFITKAYTIGVISIATTSPLPAGTNGTAYDTILMSGGGVTMPVTWAVVSGSLPTGLSLNSATGEITGTPTVNGNYAFTVQMSDAGGGSCQQPFTIAISSATLWTPAVVSPLHWYAADKITGFNNGDSMYSWPDLGTGNNALGANSGGGTPTYMTNQLNGLPILNWNPFGNDSSLIMQVTGATPGVNNPLSPSWDGFSQANIFFVAQVQTTIVSQVGIFTQIGSTAAPFYNVQLTTAKTAPYQYGINIRTTSATGLTQITGATAPSGGYDILAYQAQYSTALASLRVNGSADFTSQAFLGAGNSGSSTATQVLGDNGFNTPANIAEIVIDTNPITLATIQKYEGYFAWKYGLQGNLPIGHPYKSAPPTV